MTENHRQRIAAGMIKVTAERGFHNTTVSLVVKAAGMSRRTFYRHFSSKEESFFETYAMFAEFLLGAIREAGAGEGDWPARVRAELEAMLEAFSANPDLVRFALIAPPAAGGAVAERYRRFLQELVAVLLEGKPRDTRRPGDAAEKGLMGGLVALLVDKVQAGEGESLADLTPDLTELVLTPYIGRQRAIAAARAA